MLDIYESIRVIKIPEVSPSLIDRFAAWCSLNKIHKLDNEVKENFLSEILNTSENRLEKILKQAWNPPSLKGFWHQNFENIHVEKIDSKVSAEEKKEFFQIWPCPKLAEYLGIRVNSDKVTLHVVSNGRQEVKFYYFHKSGSIILADISLKNSKVSSHNPAKFFKAWSDDSDLEVLDKRISIAKSEDLSKVPTTHIIDPISWLNK